MLLQELLVALALAFLSAASFADSIRRLLGERKAAAKRRRSS
jgi:hypothetical protein